MKELRELICIGCPMGCAMTVTVESGAVVSVDGNTCKRGGEYAHREVIAPTRMLTTTLPVSNGERPTVPVKTNGEVPKPMLLDCARALSTIKLSAPIRAGEVVVSNLLGPGIDVIAVKNIDRA